MIVKFFKHGKGSESENPAASITGALNYLMGNHDADGNRRSIDPVWLRGDAENMRQIVGYGNHAGSYTSGVLRFVEDLADAQQQEVIDEFERALLPGLDPGQYLSNWVLHKEKGGTELHFLVAGEELSTGKRVNAYYHEKDRHRLYHWRRAMDAENGFADPDDPARVRPVASHHDLPSDKSEIIERMENYLLSLVKAGVVNNRKEVKEVIEQLEGVEISRETKNQISIKVEGRKQPIPLKGAIYKSDFRSDQLVGRELDRKSRQYKEQAQERAKEARSRFEELHAKRAEYYQERYGKGRYLENIPPDPGPASSIVHRADNGFSSDHGDEELHHREEAPEPARLDPVPQDRELRRARSVPPKITPTPTIYKKDNSSEREKSVRPRSFKFYERVLSGVQKARRSAKEYIKESVRTSVSIAKRAGDRAAKLFRNGEKLRSDGRKLLDDGEEISRITRRAPSLTPQLGRLEFNVERLRKYQVSIK